MSLDLRLAGGTPVSLVAASGLPLSLCWRQLFASHAQCLRQITHSLRGETKFSFASSDLAFSLVGGLLVLAGGVAAIGIRAEGRSEEPLVSSTSSEG